MDKRKDAEAWLLRLDEYFWDSPGEGGLSGGEAGRDAGRMGERPGLSGGEGVGDDSFLGGRLGLLFYYYHLAAVTGEGLYAGRAEELLATVFDHINAGGESLPGTNFSNGIGGFAYVLSFLNKEGYIDLDIPSELADIDQLLFEMASVQIEHDCTDYLHGAFGVLHYFVQRQPDERACYYMDSLILQACDRRVVEGDACWFRNYSLRTPANNHEEINFSLSHGLSGILLILMNAYDHSVHKELIREVVGSGVRFVLRHQLREASFGGDVADGHTLFPFAIRNRDNPFAYPERMAWCYGDLNEVLLFYRAGKLLQDSSLTELAEEIGRRSVLRRTADSTMITDSQFCHGASGIAQFYRVLYEESGSGFYLDAYEYWIGQTMVLLEKDLAEGVFRGKRRDYLEGLVGVAFTLLSYSADKRLNWSKSLLL